MRNVTQHGSKGSTVKRKRGELRAIGYRSILADPGWSYKDKASAGKRGAVFKYRTMSKEEIMALPVEQLAARDSALFLWVPMPLLPIGLAVMGAWGFEYKTVAFTWIKMTKHGKLFWGMGNWTRANSELCLLGIKGKPKRRSASVHSVIESQIRKHSQKPDETRERIVQLMGDVKRVELFARETVDDWHSWGDENINPDIALVRIKDGKISEEGQAFWVPCPEGPTMATPLP